MGRLISAASRNKVDSRRLNTHSAISVQDMSSTSVEQLSRLSCCHRALKGNVCHPAQHSRSHVCHGVYCSVAGDPGGGQNQNLPKCRKTSIYWQLNSYKNPGPPLPPEPAPSPPLPPPPLHPLAPAPICRSSQNSSARFK